MRAILNVAVGGNYPAGQARLAESLTMFGEVRPCWLFHDTWPNTSHSEVPYKFKVDAFLEARQQGIGQAIWLDASCWLVRPLDNAWEQIVRDGYLLGQEGWSVGQWCSDEVLALLGRTRSEANDMTLVEGKMIGLDFTSAIGNEFLDTWHKYSVMGAFNGSWSNHRHDITAAGFIASDLKLKLTPHLIEFSHKGNPHPRVYVRASGL